MSKGWVSRYSVEIPFASLWVGLRPKLIFGRNSNSHLIECDIVRLSIVQIMYNRNAIGHMPTTICFEPSA